jgi:glycosyltransferase involved in cell wall biosynthesis
MTKKVVAIVSVLKTVADTRNYEKIATSISNTNKYEINIIGFCSKKLPVHENIIFHPIFSFDRLGVDRLFAQVKMLKIILKLKPELIIVTCTELLIVITAYRILFGGKIIYDIQENYFRNIIYTNTFPAIIKYPLASLVRMTEYICSPLVNMFFLAEKVYQKQLRFIGKRYQIIENKTIIPVDLLNRPQLSNNKTIFLYSGTIAEHYGIFEAILFIDRLYQIYQNIELRIVGFAPDKRIFEKVRGMTQQKNYINIVGGDTLIPHYLILKEISTSDFCLLPYRKNRATEGRIPTKLYECLAMEKPVIISPDPIWETIISENNAGIAWDFTDESLPDQKLFGKSYYGNNLSMQYQWKAESKVVCQAVDDLIYANLK